MLLDAYAANCSTTWITSQAEADTLRQNCPIVWGHVGIGPFEGNDTVHINLDGIQHIVGTLGESPLFMERYSTQPEYTLSASSLQRVDAVEFGLVSTKIVNLTLPRLVYANDYVNIGRRALDLTYLDITNLHSARSITLGAPDLRTLHHTRLRNVTTLWIYPMQIESLDSLSDNELDMEDVYIYGPFPNINNIPIGFSSVQYFVISANSSLTLGGSSTKNMTINQLYLKSVTGLKRSTKLETLEADHLEISNSFLIPHLEIPFDNLSDLTIWDDDRKILKSITLPPQSCQLDSGPDLNLTSIYGADDQGKRIQTWYWPKNVSGIHIAGATVGNAFFEPFVAQQMSPSNDLPPSNLQYFRVFSSPNSTSFNCTIFRELEDIGRLPSDKSNFECDDYHPSSSTSSDTSGAIPIQAPITLSLVSAMLGICIWML
ncbi:uncharacterized protein N7479_009931 [Penicillium vulpinum]|uniref:uncharacterized protein n=1 Tax=Penicillium vulpinum TaxID=29845 RepID=UPI002549B3BA|nr:uncharacterized protein N7479_009931 [Penicillium vulpinum]KAJ5951518.1 hypothetical protein N7479_009931 [Penicillium vulpinum]